MTDRPRRSRDQVLAELTAAIKACQEASGRRLPSLAGDSTPLTYIPGFDSLCGIEVTVDLQDRLGLQLEDNIFVKTVGGKLKPRTVEEIVEILAHAKS